MVMLIAVVEVTVLLAIKILGDRTDFFTSKIFKNADCGPAWKQPRELMRLKSFLLNHNIFSRKKNQRGPINVLFFRDTAVVLVNYS